MVLQRKLLWFDASLCKSRFNFASEIVRVAMSQSGRLKACVPMTKAHSSAPTQAPSFKFFFAFRFAMAKECWD